MITIMSHASGLMKFNPTNMRHTRHAAQVDEHERASTADAYDGRDDRRHRHALKRLYAEHVRRACHNQTASRQADEEHERHDVQAP